MRYSNEDWDDLSYELNKFLENHDTYELLKLVADAVEYKEHCSE